MSSIIRKRINNTIYIYEVKSYRDKDKRVRTKWKILGKEDSDGILIASKKRKKLPAQIIRVKKVSNIIKIKILKHSHSQSQTGTEANINHEYSNNGTKQLHGDELSKSLISTWTQSKIFESSRSGLGE
ncbi:MAG: hypothetical protein IJS99_09855 [Synergistaceae bacterium]|nr:hypothetical protein [Synergistaceae bacterium]